MRIPLISRWLAGREYNKVLEKLPKDVVTFVRASLPRYTDLSRGMFTPTNYIRLVQEYSGWAYVCARKNAEAVASVPFRLYRGTPHSGVVKGRVTTRVVPKAIKDRLFSTAALMPYTNKAVDIEEVLDHPWLTLLSEVNPFLNGFDLKSLTLLFKQVTGNSYWYVPKSLQGTPTQIWIMPAQYVQVIADPVKFIAGYEYGVADPKEFFPPEDVVHFKYPSPTSMYYGMGPLEAMFVPVTLNQDFDEFNRAMLDNGAAIPFYLTSDLPIGQTALEKQSKQLQRLHKGFTKAGKIAVLQQGVKALPMAWNPKDINYAIGLKTSKEKIAAGFGVPLSLLGVEDVNKANADAGYRAYMRDTIMPELVSMADMINQNIMPLYDEKLFVAPDNCVPEDKEFNLKLQESRISTGVWSRNEVRETDGKEPDPDGDVLLVPNNLTPIDQVINPPDPPPMPNPFEMVPGEDEDEESADNDNEDEDADSDNGSDEDSAT